MFINLRICNKTTYEKIYSNDSQVLNGSEKHSLFLKKSKNNIFSIFIDKSSLSLEAKEKRF